MKPEMPNSDGWTSIGSDPELRAGIHTCALSILDTKWMSVATVLHYCNDQLLELKEQLGQETLEEIAGALRIISADFHGRGDAISKDVSVTLQETAITFWNKYSDGEDASWVKIGGQRFKNEHVSLRDPYFKGTPHSKISAADMSERATTQVAPPESALRDALTCGIPPLCPM
ncbi:MAG: hypothetical protein Q8Q13_01535 [bacterium]|nr:hypothetical protein [bacterium]